MTSPLTTHLTKLLPTCCGRVMQISLLLSPKLVFIAVLFFMLLFLPKTEKSGFWHWHVVWVCPVLQLLKNFIGFHEIWYKHYVRGDTCSHFLQSMITAQRTHELVRQERLILKLCVVTNSGKMCTFWYINMFRKHELQHRGRGNIFISFRFAGDNQGRQNLAPMQTINTRTR
jgi:hypothetical protein